MLDNEPQDNLGSERGERDEVTRPVNAADDSTAPAGGETADSSAPVAPARRTRAPRKKAAAAAAPAEPDTAAEPEATEPVAPVKKATRARKKAAAPAAAPAAEDTPPDEAAPVAPVKAVRARRKKAAAPAAPVEEPAAEIPAAPEAPEAPAEPVAVDALVAGEEPLVEDEEEAETLPVVPPVVPVAEEVAEEPAPTRSRRRAALPPAVLFMPPDPAEAEAAVAPPARRSRRAVPPVVATPPAEAAELGIETEAPVAEAAPVVTDEPADTSRRSRRRRRGPAAEEPVEEIETAEPVLVDKVDETADDVEDEAEDDGEDEDGDLAAGRRRRRRGRRGRGRGKGPAEDGDEDAETEEGAQAATEEEAEDDEESDEGEGEGEGVTRRRRRRRRKGSGGDAETGGIEDGVHTVVRVREPRRTSDEVQGVSGSTRLEAKRQRRRDGREQRRTRPPILSESEFLARREAVDRVMVVRQKPDRIQIVVLEDGVLVEHYVSRSTSGTMVGNVYLGKVQNVLPSMEAAFVDIGRGRNAVLYAGEVNWDATGLEGRARSIEQALRSGDPVLVQVTKDPIGHKGARLSSHIALSGRHLVYVPNGNASGISRKLPDNERKRLRDVLKKLVPDGAGVIVRTAAEGASEDDLARDVKRLQAQWEDIQRKAADGHAPTALSEEPDLEIRVVRDLFNEDFRELIVQGEQTYTELETYLNSVSPELVERMHRYTGVGDVFAEKRIDEQILKGLDRKVFLPSGGHLVFDRTEAMTVVDVNTGKYTGAGGNLEETVTRNNLEAAEEIVRQLRLRDLGGIVVIDFIDMVLESNRELVLRRLTECLGRDRTKHQVTEITSLGLVQMTRKRIGAGLLEAFSETCDHCKGRGVIIHTEPVPEKRSNGGGGAAVGSQVKAVAAAAKPETAPPPTKSRRRRGGGEPAVIEAAPVEAAVLADPVRVEPERFAVEPERFEVEPERFEPERVVAPVVEAPPRQAPPAQPAAQAPQSPQVESPVAVTAGLPPVHGSGIVTATRISATDDDVVEEYDISGYDLSRYEAAPVAGDPEPLRLTGSGDPDAADEEEDDEEEEGDEPVGAGAGRRRARRGGTRRRTRP